MNNKTFQFDHISIPCLVKAVLRNLWMVVAAALIFSMSTSLFHHWTHQDMYQASVTYAVTSRRTSYTSGGNTTSAREVASVLAEMLPSDMVREKIRNSSPSLSGFNGSISASQVAGNNFIVVRVQDDNPEEAFQALQAVIDQLPTIISYISSGNILQIIRNPVVSASAVNAVNVPRRCMLAGILGGVAMVALLCWLSIRRETIQTRTGARHLLDAEIIATVHREQRTHGLRSLLTRIKKDKPLQVFAPTTSFAYTEQINTICSRMQHEAAERGSKIFMIAGAGENEGKSTISGNVAAALSLMGKKVAILDCDLRKPSLNQFFDKKYTASIPLNQLLSAPLTRDALLQCMQRHPKLNLFMLFPTAPDKRCSELLSGQTLSQLLHQLRVFDFVILDTPPMGYFAEAESLAQQVDATMLVVRQDRTPAADINDCADTLRAAPSRFLGCILNDMSASLTEGTGYGYGYGYGGYGYGYGYGQKKTRKTKKSK